MKLLQPTIIGQQTLKNKMVMAAMTRSRASVEGNVSDLTVEYYTQRASAGLILSEAVNISEQALGSPYTPGLFTAAQIEAWKKVTQSVHDNGGLIYAQLWHTGRVGHSVDRDNKLPVAPSAIAIDGQQHFTSQGPKNYETPQELTIAEIKSIIKDYGNAAKSAIEAGFDGIELHAANGYLPNQFLAESSNARTDEYGGNIENNSRFILEVMQEHIEVIGGDKVGIKISPLQGYNGIVLNNPVDTFTYLIQELNKLDIVFVELMRRSPMFPFVVSYPDVDEIEFFGPLVNHTLIANTGYTRETAEEALEKGAAALISFGSSFLANPDLPKRFKANAPLNEPDRATMFGGNEIGYTDYPFMN